jgi:tRNA-Thr(GGU) m(6)t(6)A37 methyltransferase TsaA
MGDYRGKGEEDMETTRFTMTPIGHVRSPYLSEKDVPRGLGAQQRAEGTLELLPEYADGLLDIEGFSHLYVLWVFHRASGFALVSTPPCDDRPHGVFASRTPSRPNPIGLTTVRLLGRRDNVLNLRGVDMVDGTPVIDIKPYLSSVPDGELSRGWLAEAEARKQAGSASS